MVENMQSAPASRLFQIRFHPRKHSPVVRPDIAQELKIQAFGASLRQIGARPAAVIPVALQSPAETEAARIFQENDRIRILQALGESAPVIAVHNPRIPLKKLRQSGIKILP